MKKDLWEEVMDLLKAYVRDALKSEVLMEPIW